MAGSQTLRRRGGRFAAALAVSFLTSAGRARAQYPSPPSPPAAMPARELCRARRGRDPAGDDARADDRPRTLVLPRLRRGTDGARVEMGLFDTITESLFGDASAEGKWRPLTLGNFFSEGWLEPWAGGPAGQSGLTPRHGWLGAFEGVFYRLWLVNGIYQNNLNKPYGGNGYRGDFAIFLPFSRRFELFLNVPFVAANGTEDPKRGYRSDFGDMSIAGSFLLSETEAFTQLFTLGTIVPTGQTETGGNLMTVFPRYSFWSNPGGAWVVRGGTGVNVPLNKNDQRPAPVFTPGGGLLFGESTAQTTLQRRPGGRPLLHAARRAVRRPRVLRQLQRRRPARGWRSADVRRGRPRHAVPDHRQLVVPALLGVPAGRAQAVRLPDADRHREGVVIPGPCRRRDRRRSERPRPLRCQESSRARGHTSPPGRPRTPPGRCVISRRWRTSEPTATPG